MRQGVEEAGSDGSEHALGGVHVLLHRDERAEKSLLALEPLHGARAREPLCYLGTQPCEPGVTPRLAHLGHGELADAPGDLAGQHEENEDEGHGEGERELVAEAGDAVALERPDHVDLI